MNTNIKETKKMSAAMIGFGIGLVLGSVNGFFICSLMVMAKESQTEEVKNEKTDS